MEQPPIPTYRPGLELRIVTSGNLRFSGPVIQQIGDFLTIHDRMTNREISVNLFHVQSVEVFPNPKAPPDHDDHDEVFHNQQPGGRHP